MVDLTFTPVIDSYYSHVKSRILAINSARKFGGISDAQDWPGEQVALEAFYLLNLGETPLGKKGFSGSSPIYIFTTQWSWIISGTEIVSGVQGRNRGDKYRINAMMKAELLHGAYPLATEKMVTGLDASNLVTRTSFDPKEFIYWQPLQFTQRSDKESGVIYGIATAYLTGISSAITA